MEQLHDSNLGKKIMVNSGDPLAQNMTTVGSGRDMINNHHALSNKEFRSYEDQGVVVMVYTVDSPSRFSQLWCLGVDYVKTNALHLLVPLTNPTWIIPYRSYITIWVSVTLIGITVGTLVFILKNRKNSPISAN